MSDGDWRSIALFFNLPDDIEADGYQRTTSNDALSFLDLGADPATVPASEYLNRYWKTLTYGELDFGLDTPRDHTGRPLVPTLRPEDDDPQDWGGLIDLYLERHAEAAWLVAGGQTDSSGRRLIPSVVLIQNYDVWATAGYRGFEAEYGGATYLIGDRTHIGFDLLNVDLPNGTDTAKRYLGVLCHEFAHNFAEFADLYGPGGAAGHWDLLGVSPTPGRMPEVSSQVKEQIGWLDFSQTIVGPRYVRSNFSLRPYTTSGDAIKVVPDPDNNPHEYFLLEYRTSTGDEPWRPDGALEDDGLLIWHVNDRLGVSGQFLAREAPYLDPERADFADLGKARRDEHSMTDGALFPNGRNNSFTRTSEPSSAFYGGRASGLSVENIRVSGGRCRFSIDINLYSWVGWRTSEQDRAVAFRPYRAEQPHYVFVRNHERAAMLRMMENQWFVVASARGWIGDWELTPQDRPPLVGDFTGDGGDDLYMRDDDRAGIISYNGTWVSRTVQSGWIDGWNLGRNDRETVADFDGDGIDEVVVASDRWMGLFKFDPHRRGGRLGLRAAVEGSLNSWEFGPAEMLAGRFRQEGVQDVALLRGDELGLIAWDPRRQGFRLVRKEEGRIGRQWALNARNDKYVVGDFDGDGLDEIFVRSHRYAAMFKWRRNRFATVWVTSSPLPNLSDGGGPGLALRGGHDLYRGKFYRADLPADPNQPSGPQPRDCVLHSDHGGGLWILSWDADQAIFGVRQRLDSPFRTSGPNSARWSHRPGDRLVIGDFHDTGLDPTLANQDFIGDHVEDIFLHNGWGTATVGVNQTEWDPLGPNTGRVREEMGLTWLQRASLMQWQTGTWPR